MGLDTALQPVTSSQCAGKGEQDWIGPSQTLMRVLREVRAFAVAAAKEERSSNDAVDFKFESGRLLVRAVGSTKLVVMMCIDKPQFSWISRAPLRQVDSA
jgi:hypothetical protein